MSLHSKAQKLSYKSLFLILVSLLIPIVLLLRIGQRAHLVSAGWFDDGWGYRKAVNITNSVGTTLTNFQVSISIGTSALITAGKMQSDCDDLRITDQGGNLLSHWIEKNTNNSCNKTSTLVWIKVPSIPTSGGAIYVYYGNPSATNVENGKLTFPDYFEDFSSFSNGTDITNVSSNWSKDVDYLSTYTIDTNRLKMIHPGTAPNEARDGAIYTFPNEITTNFAVDADVTVADSNSYDFMMIAADSGWTGMASSHTASALWSVIINENWQGWSSSDSNWLSAQSGLTVGNIYQFGITFDISGDLAKMYVDDTYKIDRAFPDTGTTGLKKIAFGNYGYSSIDSTWYVDNIRVRKHASTPPTSTLSSSEEQSKAPVAYWKFDEGYGTTPKDSTQNNQHFTNIGGSPAWQTEDMCVAGKCLRFPTQASYSYFTVSSTSPLNLGASDFTISNWQKVFQPTVHGSGIIGRYPHNTSYNGNFSTGISDDLTTYFFYHRTSGGTLLNYGIDYTAYFGNWTYVSWVKSGSTMNLYLNGVFNKQFNITEAFNISFSGQTFWVSNTGWAPGIMSNLTIDDLKIYKYARTAAEIKTDYNAGKAHAAAAEGVAVNLGSNKNNSEAFSEGLVGYWKMDENVGTTTLDSSGNNNTGVFGGGTSSPSWSTGKFGIGTSFDGNNDLITAGTTPVFDITNKLTISTWFYASNNTQNSGLACKWTTGGGNNNSYCLYLGQDAGTSKVAFNIEQANNTYVTVFPSTPYSANTWNHLVGVADGSKLHLYLNGVEIGTTTYDGTIKTTTKQFVIGRLREEDSTYPFNGIMDEVRIYNRALTPNEVSQLYDWAPGPVAYYNFEEGVGTSAYDTSGNSNNGSWSGTGTHWTAGKFGKAGKFNGTSDYVSVADTDSLDVNNFTAGFWIKFNSASGNQRLISKGGVSNASNFYLWRNDGNTLLYYGFGKGASKDESSFNPNFAIGQWYKVDLLYNGSAVQVYIDGVYRSQMATTATPNTNASTLELGYSTISGGNYFNGLIDEVKIYNYARTQKQIVSDLNAGHPAVGSPVGSAIAHYRFDEGYDSTVNNSGSVGSTLNGTFGSSPRTPSWTNNGKFGKALSFDASTPANGDIVNIPDNAALQVTTGLTISAWINPSTRVPSQTEWVVGRALGVSPWDDYNLIRNGNNIAMQVRLASGMITATATNVIATTGIWYHLLGTYDAITGKLNLYINGQNKSSASGTGNIQVLSTRFKIGCWGTTADNCDSTTPFNGLIDEVKIYNYALTEDEVKIDYNQGKSLVMGSLSSGTGNTAPSTAASQEYCIPGDASACSAPVARWDFNEGVGTTAYDISGNANHGVLGTGNSSPAWSKGKIGGGLSFDGAISLIGVSDPGASWSLDLTSGITIESWALPPSFPSGHKGIVWKDSAYGIKITDNYLRAGIYDSGWKLINSSTLPGPGQWIHTAMTYNGTTVRLYLNGIDQGTTAAGTTISTNDNKVLIGQQPGYPNFLGKIDQVRIYNYARSPAQIAWDYNRGGPVGHWKFDECQGNIAHDSIGTNNGAINIGASGTQTSAGTCQTASTAWGVGATGKTNSSINFDGTDDYISVPSAAGSTTDITGSISVSAWVKPAATAGHVPNLVGKGTNNSYSYRLMLTNAYVNGGAGIDWGINAAYSNAQTEWSCGVAWVTCPLVWTHVIGTYDSSSQVMKLYINGNLVSTATGVAAPTSNANPIEIGRGIYDGTNYNLGGQIDDVKIFNYALTATQVKTLYNGGAVNFK